MNIINKIKKSIQLKKELSDLHKSTNGFIDNIDINELYQLFFFIYKKINLKSDILSLSKYNISSVVPGTSVYAKIEYIKTFRNTGESNFYNIPKNYSIHFDNLHTDFLDQINKYTLMLIINALLNDPDISSKLNKNIFKQLNENSNYSKSTINNIKKISLLNKEIDSINNQINNIKKSIDYDNLIDIFNTIMTKLFSTLNTNRFLIKLTNKKYFINGQSCDIIGFEKYSDKSYIIVYRNMYTISEHFISFNGLHKNLKLRLISDLMNSEEIIKKLNISTFKSINEDKPVEFRLNYLKNFNHFNKDQMGGMEIFAPRINSEINRMVDDMDMSDNNGGEDDDEIYQVSDIDTEETGLNINPSDDYITPERTLDYPYGFDNNPKPSFKLDNKTQSKSGLVLRFADYRGINNFR